MDPSTGAIDRIEGLEILFEKDRTEELSGFKMPLMFVGVGVAFAYQLCCKGDKKRPKQYGKKSNPQYNRRERMSKLNKRISQLEGSFD